MALLAEDETIIPTILNVENSHEEETQECIPIPAPCFHPFHCLCSPEKVRQTIIRKSRY